MDINALTCEFLETITGMEQLTFSCANDNGTGIGSGDSGNSINAIHNRRLLGYRIKHFIHSCSRVHLAPDAFQFVFIQIGPRGFVRLPLELKVFKGGSWVGVT